MRVVHVRAPPAAFADTLGELRESLDRHKRPLVRFETEWDGDTIIISVQFDSDDLAELCSGKHSPALSAAGCEPI
jgi:hypothetical protein